MVKIGVANCCLDDQSLPLGVWEMSNTYRQDPLPMNRKINRNCPIYLCACTLSLVIPHNKRTARLLLPHTRIQHLYNETYNSKANLLIYMYIIIIIKFNKRGLATPLSQTSYWATLFYVHQTPWLLISLLNSPINIFSESLWCHCCITER